MMWRIKALADPDGVLAPGVLLNRDNGVHLRNLKSAPTIEEEADACVECGFCEPVCPSRHLTTTPRQRIVLRREMARQPAGSAVLRALLEEYEYDAIETCAADGTCRIACPLGIDTGKLVKGLREREHGPRAERVALAAARRWAAVERGARGGLRAGDVLRRAVGDGPLRGVTRAVRSAVSAELVPEWPAGMPRPAPAALPVTARAGAAAVYLPACINRIFGETPGSERALSLPEALVEVSRRAGLPVWIPPDAAGHCCATPWNSKGYRAGADLMAARTLDALWRWSDEGALPVVIDASSCALGLVEDMAAHLDDGRRERLAAIDGARPGRLGGQAPAGARGAPARAVGRGPPAVRGPPPGPHARPRGARRGARRGGPRPALGDLLRLRGRPRVPASRAARRGDRGRGGRGARPLLRRPPVQQPHVRDRPPPGHRRRLHVVPLPARRARRAHSRPTEADRSSPVAFTDGGECRIPPG